MQSGEVVGGISLRRGHSESWEESGILNMRKFQCVTRLQGLNSTITRHALHSPLPVYAPFGIPYLSVPIPISGLCAEGVIILGSVGSSPR